MLTAAARPVAARFLLHRTKTNTNTVLRSMGTIAEGVEFDTIAREWRCKVSKADGTKMKSKFEVAAFEIGFGKVLGDIAHTHARIHASSRRIFSTLGPWIASWFQ